MALPDSGRISMNDIHMALGEAPEIQCSLNDSDFRSLAGKPNGVIKMSDFHGAALLPSYFEGIPTHFFGSSSTMENIGTVYSGEVVHTNPQTDKKNVLIIIGHLSIIPVDHSNYGHISVSLQNGTNQSLGYWYSHELNKTIMAPIRPSAWQLALGTSSTPWRALHAPGGKSSNRVDYTDEIRGLQWPGGSDYRNNWNFIKLTADYSSAQFEGWGNSWAIWSEGQNVDTIRIKHSGSGWNGFMDVEVYWE